MRNISNPTTCIDISFRRGDTFNFNFVRKTNEKPPQVIMERLSNVFFTVKENYNDSDFVMQKRLDDDTISFDSNTGIYSVLISPEDTNDLYVNSIYVYDIEFVTENNKLTRIVGELVLKPEVTFAINEV